MSTDPAGQTIHPFLTSLPREEQFLQKAMSSFVRSRTAPVMVGAPEDLDWQRLGRIIAANQIGPLGDCLFSGRPLPSALLDQWKKLRLQTLFSNIHKLRVAVRLFSIFEQAGLRSVGLRGLTLAHTLYPDAGLRPMKDLDILVDTHDHQQVVQIMRAQGHEPANLLRTQVVYVMDGVEIELHLSLLTAKRYRDVMDSDVLLGSRSRVATREGDVFRLPADHELLELVTHAFVHHELQGYARVLDIALMMCDPGIHWDFVSAWCRDKGLTNMFLFTLSYADALFGLELHPERHFSRILPARVRRRFASYSAFLFGGNSIRHFVRRKRNLFFIAETPATRFRELLRLFSGTTCRELQLALGRKRPPGPAGLPL